MEYRELGGTGVKISEISFGAGPVPALMTDERPTDIQQQTIRRALEAGINWFDTAASYGEGRSERHLGISLKELDALDQAHIATKVRLMPDQLDDIAGNIRKSVIQSLERLQRNSVTLIQLHNSITENRGDQHTSITPQDVLGKNGVLQTLEKLRSDRLFQHIGLTGLGDMPSLAEVIKSGSFQTIQVCYNILNPSAGRPMPEDFDDVNYGNIMAECARQNMGVIVIRVLAGGAVAGHPPSAHTKRTRFFPLSMYERDREKAKRLGEKLPPGLSLKEAAVRFALNAPQASTALVGLSNPDQVDEMAGFCSDAPLEKRFMEAIRAI